MDKVDIPIESLSDELLDAVIEEFVLREGTDYGSVEFSLAAKVQQVKRQLINGDVKIVFDIITESVTLMTLRDWRRDGVNRVAPDETSR